MKLYLIYLIGLTIVSCSLIQKPESAKDQWIKPWENNPSYWQYRGEPVLLLGGTISNNIFRPGMEVHLDSLKAIGGNYIRVTMSIGGLKGGMFAAMKDEGYYDLNSWNDEYWNQLEHVLRLSYERDIIVQLEVWDRFDHSRDSWLPSPYNPKNNINYTYEEAGLDSLYPLHPGANVHPFFFTVKESTNNEVLLPYQEAFVKKLLSITLEFDNILYCIDNETSGVEEWAVYWADFIKDNAQEKDIYITQMWDPWDVKTEMHKRTLDHPDRYHYIDISQNSHIPGCPNWDNAQFVFEYIKYDPRPVNSTKIYGSDNYEPWLHRGMTTDHAVQAFFRNILGGFASSRFHRPPHGLGLSQPSINSIKSIRAIEEYVKMWEVTPRMDLIPGIEGNEAYLAAREGDKYVVYFPQRGSVKIDLTEYNNKFTVKWINTENAQWDRTFEIDGGRMADLNALNEKGSIAVLIRK